LRTKDADQLKAEAKSVDAQLKKAEKAAAEEKEANARLQGQVQDLTKSRDELSAKVEELSAARADLQKRVDDLTSSRDQLQVMVSSLVDTRGTLEKQVAALTKARDAARTDAVSAQTRIDQLTDKLKSQTQQMVDLQDQMTAVRAVLQQLQQKLQ
jgi:chromosome segregation ATPase